MSSTFRQAIITAKKPTYLSKHFVLADGKAQLTGKSGLLISGTCTTSTFDIESLAQTIKTMQPNKALVLGLPNLDSVGITSNETPIKGHIRRTANNFPFRKEPALIFLDHDVRKDGVKMLESRQAFYEVICQTLPLLGNVPAIARDSASSHIYNTKTGECLKGEGGYRLYFLVDDATKTPVIFERLEYELWKLGRGYVEIDKAGRIHKRTIVDLSFDQPGRLDFAAGAKCGAGLEQRLPDIATYNSAAKPANTSEFRPLTNEEKTELFAMQMEAAQRNEGMAREVRAQHAKARIRIKLGESAFNGEVIKPEYRDKAVRVWQEIQAASIGSHLPLNWPINTRNGVITVEDIRRNPVEYAGRDCADPLEPDYNGGSITTARINVSSSGDVWIYSHAHGGIEYTLAEIETVALGKELRFENAQRAYAYLTQSEPISTRTRNAIDQARSERTGRRALNKVLGLLIREGVRNPSEAYGIVLKLDDLHKAKEYLKAREASGEKAFEHTLVNAFLDALDYVEPIGLVANPSVEQITNAVVVYSGLPEFMEKYRHKNNHKKGEAA